MPKGGDTSVSMGDSIESKPSTESENGSFGERQLTGVSESSEPEAPPFVTDEASMTNCLQVIENIIVLIATEDLEKSTRCRRDWGLTVTRFYSPSLPQAWNDILRIDREVADLWSTLQRSKANDVPCAAEREAQCVQLFGYFRMLASQELCRQYCMYMMHLDNQKWKTMFVAVNKMLCVVPHWMAPQLKQQLYVQSMQVLGCYYLHRPDLLSREVLQHMHAVRSEHHRKPSAAATGASDVVPLPRSCDETPPLPQAALPMVVPPIFAKLDGEHIPPLLKAFADMAVITAQTLQQRWVAFPASMLALLLSDTSGTDSAQWKPTLSAFLASSTKELRCVQRETQGVAFCGLFVLMAILGRFSREDPRSFYDIDPSYAKVMAMLLSDIPSYMWENEPSVHRDFFIHGRVRKPPNGLLALWVPPKKIPVPIRPIVIKDFLEWMWQQKAEVPKSWGRRYMLSIDRCARHQLMIDVSIVHWLLVAAYPREFCTDVARIIVQILFGKVNSPKNFFQHLKA